MPQSDLLTRTDAAREAGRPAAAPRPDAGPVVKLVGFPPVWGRNASPFGLKLETWLRLAGVPFEARASFNLSKAPRGRLPFLVDGGREIGDTTLIIEHLKATRGLDPDAGLSPRARAEAVALQRLFEDHLHPILAYSRFVDPEGWRVMRRDAFGALPLPARPFARRAAGARVRAMMAAAGLDRHSRAEVYALGRADLAAAAGALGDRPFFAGEQLTTIDAVAFGFLANILRVPLETELKRAARGFPNLVAWCETMEAGLYGEG